MSIESLVAERVAEKAIGMLDIEEMAQQAAALVSMELPATLSNKIIEYVRDEFDVSDMVYDAFSNGKAAKTLNKALGKAILRSVENMFEVSK